MIEMTPTPEELRIVDQEASLSRHICNAGQLRVINQLGLRVIRLRLFPPDAHLFFSENRHFACRLLLDCCFHFWVVHFTCPFVHHAFTILHVPLASEEDLLHRSRSDRSQYTHHTLLPLAFNIFERHRIDYLRV
jgi:hypothetical protein